MTQRLSYVGLLALALGVLAGCSRKPVRPGIDTPITYKGINLRVTALKRAPIASLDWYSAQQVAETSKDSIVIVVTAAVGQEFTQSPIPEGDIVLKDGAGTTAHPVASRSGISMKDGGGRYLLDFAFMLPPDSHAPYSIEFLDGQKISIPRDLEAE